MTFCMVCLLHLLTFNLRPLQQQHPHLQGQRGRGRGGRRSMWWFVSLTSALESRNTHNMYLQSKTCDLAFLSLWRDKAERRQPTNNLLHSLVSPLPPAGALLIVYRKSHSIVSFLHQNAGDGVQTDFLCVIPKVILGHLINTAPNKPGLKTTNGLLDCCILNHSSIRNIKYKIIIETNKASQLSISFLNT